MEDRPRIHSLSSGAIGPTVIMPVEDASVAHHEDTCANHAVAVGVGVEEPEERAPVVRRGESRRRTRRRCLCRQNCRHGDEAQEKRDSRSHPEIVEPRRDPCKIRRRISLGESRMSRGISGPRAASRGARVARCTRPRRAVRARRLMWPHTRRDPDHNAKCRPLVGVLESGLLSCPAWPTGSFSIRRAYRGGFGVRCPPPVPGSGADSIKAG